MEKGGGGKYQKQVTWFISHKMRTSHLENRVTYWLISGEQGSNGLKLRETGPIWGTGNIGNQYFILGIRTQTDLCRGNKRISEPPRDKKQKKMACARREDSDQPERIWSESSLSDEESLGP